MPPNSSTASTQQQRTTAWFLVTLARILRLVLWPLQVATKLLFPATDRDGLSSAVTAKAASQFVAYLQKQQQSPRATSEVWQTQGFTACQQLASQRQSLLLVYLYSPLHRLADQLAGALCRDSIVQFLNQRQDRLVAVGFSVHTAQGAHLANSLSLACQPAVAVLQVASGGNNSNNNSMQLLFAAQGPALLDLLLPDPGRLVPYLQNAVNKYETGLAAEMARQLQREQDLALRRQQDEEYAQALAADQERERVAAQEAAAQAAQEQAQQQAAQERVQNAQALVKPEPDSGGTMIRFVLPAGNKLNRRFYADETIGACKAFLFLESNIDNIGLSTNFPRQTFTDDYQTLQEAGLIPQAVLMVQDLDA